MVEDDFDPQPHKQGEQDCAFDFGLSFDLNLSSMVGGAWGIMGLWDGEHGGRGGWTLSRFRPEESLGLRTGNSTNRYRLPLPPTPTVPILASPTPLAG